jgi:hypothetical protein
MVVKKRDKIKRRAFEWREDARQSVIDDGFVYEEGFGWTRVDMHGVQWAAIIEFWEKKYRVSIFKRTK